jgi:glycosyltransferase involved in cell wall biosynthesis
MKIGIFTECYEPQINGVVHSIGNTKRGLTKLGHKVYIFAPDYKERNPRERNVYHCPSLPLPGKVGYHLVFPLPDEIKKIASKMDVIHTHHPFTMGRYASEIALANNLPLLFTHHTQYDQYTRYVPIIKESAKHALYNFLKGFCDKCTTIIAPSLGIKKVIKGYGTKTPVEVVPNSIDIKKFKQHVDLSTPKLLQGLDPDYKTIIYTGRVAYEKNIDFIIKAFRLVVSKYPEVYLLIVGGGPAIKSLQKLAFRLDLLGNVIFVGEVPYTQMKRYYHFADFFMTASKTEVHPLVILEAFAAGLPAVAVDAIGTSDTISPGHTGYITRENLDEYAQKVLYLLKNPTRLKVMSANAAKAIYNYSIPKMAKKMLETYKNAIESHKKSYRNYR